MTSRPKATAISDLFNQFDAEQRTRRMIVVVARELRRLAAQRKHFGVCAYDSKCIAIRKGFATGAEREQRALSWLAAVPKAARLYRTERTRLSPTRNANRVFVIAPEYA